MTASIHDLALNAFMIFGTLEDSWIHGVLVCAGVQSAFCDKKINERACDDGHYWVRSYPEVFDKMFNDNLQDLLMVMYLSNLTKTQLTIAEKLQESLVV